ncbi:MAG: penicillin acylase family protein, partial [Thermoleophilaceae bacterium]|nr:penicillin acylase family protein [Thermoleophilaceae bacterium]
MNSFDSGENTGAAFRASPIEMDSRFRRLLLATLVLLAVAIVSLCAVQRAEAFTAGGTISDLNWATAPPSTSGDHASTSLSILPPGNGNIYGPTFQHLDDQRGRYDGITNELAAGTLSDRTLARWFKTAELGVPRGNLERIEVVNSDSKIAWDRSGVPHVVGKTDYAGSYAFGWATAEARMAIMELLRLIGRSGFLETGGEAAITNFDIAGLVNSTQALNYSDEELNSGFDALYAEGTPEESATIRTAAGGYLNGVNAYYATHTYDLTMIAGKLGFPIGRPWTQADLGAVAIAIRDLFGDGGGGEIGTANVLTKLQSKFGATNAELIFNDLQANSPTTTYHTNISYPYPLFADPDPASGDTDGPLLGGPNAIPDAGSIVAAGSAPSSIIPSGLLARLPHMSNFAILGGSRTKSGFPIQVGGPQTGYFAPEILFEAELISPSIRARGIA